MQATEQIEHISAEIPVRVFKMLKQASAIKGETVNQILVQAAFEKAKSIIEDERIITLSERDAKAFFDAIDNPPEPNEKLIQAFVDHRETFEDVED